MDSGFEGIWENNDSLCCYIQQSELNMEMFKTILSKYELIESYTFKNIENTNWNASWESAFEPIQIGEHCLIRANFHPASNLKYEIIITPKMSFGTGHHETTSMMVETMLKLDFKNKKVLDMGCGTSVLAILAEKLGATHITAIDNDDWAIENSVENIKNNNCKHISVFKGELKFDEKFDIILSNINRNTNLEFVRLYANSLLPEGRIVLSGFYAHDISSFHEVLPTIGLTIAEVNEKNAWACLSITPC